jgi:hypothetical protein
MFINCWTNRQIHVNSFGVLCSEPSGDHYICHIYISIVISCVTMATSLSLPAVCHYWACLLLC